MAEIAGEPRYAPLILADKTCALVAANAISAALYARERTGRGQFVEVPMFETMAAFILTEHLFGHTFVPPEAPLGYPRVLAPGRRPYKTRDGHICMLAYTDPQWRKFWTAVGKPELADDPRFDTMANRTRNIAEIYRIASECLGGRTTGEWLPIFQALDIPAARVARLDDLMRDPHLEAVGLLRQVTHPSEGEIMMTNLSVRFSDTSAAVERLQPRLGEHSVEILGEAGLSEGEIQKLVASGATLDGRRAAWAAE
jgi:crotonobetainyl-CoA:carnitine CoA-transferase CaiB-like acyl-CoA transferase